MLPEPGVHYSGDRTLDLAGSISLEEVIATNVSNDVTATITSEARTNIDTDFISAGLFSMMLLTWSYAYMRRGGSELQWMPK